MIPQYLVSFSLKLLIAVVNSLYKLENCSVVYQLTVINSQFEVKQINPRLHYNHTIFVKMRQVLYVC